MAGWVAAAGGGGGYSHDSTIHQSWNKPLKRVSSTQTKFGKKVKWEKMRRPGHDEWVKRTEIIRGRIQLFAGICKVVMLDLLLLRHACLSQPPRNVQLEQVQI